MKRLLMVLCSFALLLPISSCTNDPCEEVACVNGNCNDDGACDCEERYEGTLCDQEKTPSSITIDEVVVLNVPPTLPNGFQWESDSTGPDMFLYIDVDTNRYFASNNFPDAVSGQEYVFNVDLKITDINQLHDITILDRDGAGFQYDVMFGANFVPWEDTKDQSFPESITLSSTGMDVNLKLSYQFD